MGKRITQQARGRGSLTFRVRPKAYRYKITYPRLNTTGKAKIVKLFNSSAHSTPLVKVLIDKQSFLVPAASGIYEGQEILINELRESGNPEIGDILRLKDVPQGVKIFNLEISPGKGGKYVRSSGCSAIIMSKDEEKDEKEIEVIINKRKLKLHKNCRVIIGVAAGEGRKTKPFVKAGKMHHLMLSKGRKWHRTSPVKVNAVDHPFGGGRGKRIKSKIAKRNSPPGRKVGHLSPSRTGKRN